MSRTSRSVGLLVVASLVALGLVGAYFLVDSMLRTYAQNRVRQDIISNLPDGVAGDLAVSIGGQSVIAQYLSGSFERVAIVAPRLRFNGAEASVHVVATDVPVDTAKPVGDVRGSVEMDQDSVNTLLSAAGVPLGSTVDLGDNTVSYTGTVSVVGIPLGYRATARPDVRPDAVTLKPVSARVTSDFGSLNLTSVVERLVGENPITVCVAQYLPAGVSLTSATVTPDRVRLTLHAPALKLDEASLSSRGTCPTS